MAIADADRCYRFPGPQTFHGRIPAVTAASGTVVTPLFTAPFNLEVTHVEIILLAAVTGTAANHRTSIVFKWGRGASAAPIRSITKTKQLRSLNANVSQEFDLVDSETSTLSRFVGAGEAVMVNSVKVGNGVAVGDLLITIQYQAR